MARDFRHLHTRGGDRAALEHLLARTPGPEDADSPAFSRPGPWSPSPALWEEWQTIYATRFGPATLRAERHALREQYARLAQSQHPDPLALGMVAMKLALVRDRLGAFGDN
jgi:hypothetical protein